MLNFRYLELPKKLALVLRSEVLNEDFQTCAIKTQVVVEYSSKLTFTDPFLFEAELSKRLNYLRSGRNLTVNDLVSYLAKYTRGGLGFITGIG